MNGEQLLEDLTPEANEAILNNEPLDFGSDGFYYNLHNYGVLEKLVRKDTISFQKLQEAKRILSLLEDVYDMVCSEF